eukprot:g25637.t1
MASRDWLHSGSKRWWLDLAVQVLLYGTLDVIPLVLCIAPLTKLDLSTALSTLFASACSIAVFHCILLYGAWIVSDIVAKFYSWKSIRRPADVPHEDTDPPTSSIHSASGCVSRAELTCSLLRSGCGVGVRKPARFK